MILLEHGPEARPAVFGTPRSLIVARQPDDVGPALARAEALRAGGAWLAGWIGYEAGLALEPRLAALPARRMRAPLMVVGAFDAPLAADSALARLDAVADAARMTPPRPAVSRAAYLRALARVKEYVAAGDCYQVNLTFPLRSRLVSGDAPGLYAALRRAGAVGHGALVDLGAGPAIVSCSPELFFRIDAAGMIETRPMKGTRPRDGDPAHDAALAAELAASPKDRAENLMIVDLLRNDIGRIAVPGSVKVPALFAVESYATVHQMTSTVTGRLAAPATFPGVMRALFPCGSVTGAPKIRAMEIIRELEPHPRGVYCGAVGWMAPDGRADFSVAIRTLSVAGERVTLNVGGGVVHDSTPEGEWEEALWKARFVRAVTRPG